MNLKSFFNYMPTIISIFSIVSIVLSIRNKTKNYLSQLIKLNIIAIIYLFLTAYIIPGRLYIILTMDLLLVWFVSLLGGTLYLISIIICVVKIKKKKKHKPSNKINKTFLILILIPVILFLLIFGKETYLIKNSTLLVTYNSSGNGGFDGSRTFVYAINDEYCAEVSIDVDLAHYNNLAFLLKNLKRVEIDDHKNLDYEIVLKEKEKNIYIYKNNKLIHQKKINKKYFNISQKTIYQNN